MLNEIMVLKPSAPCLAHWGEQDWGSRVGSGPWAGQAAQVVSPCLEDRTRDRHKGSFLREKHKPVCPRPPGGLHRIQQLR